MSLWKSPVLYLGLVLVLVIGAALIAPYVVDWGAYRGNIEAYSAKLVGRKVTITGPIAARLFPWPRLQAKGLSVANADGLGPAPMLKANMISVQLALASLFSGQIKIEGIDLDQPNLALSVMANGQGNWHFNPDVSRLGGGLLTGLQLDQIRFSNGTLLLDDARHGLRRQISGVTGAASSAAIAGPWRVKAVGRDGTTPLDLSLSTAAAKIGEPLAFTVGVSPQDGSWPAVSFDGQGNGSAWSGKIYVDPVVTADGRSSLGGSFKPLAAQARVDLSGDVAKFTSIRIVPVDPKDSGTLIEGEATIDFSHGTTGTVHLSAPHIALDSVSGESAWGLSETGGLMGAINGLIARFPDKLDLSAELDVNALSAAGETLENIAVKATASSGAIRVQGLEADLPGHSRVRYSGIIFPGPEAAELGGNLAFESSDARAFSQWLWPQAKDNITQIWTGQRGHFKAQTDVYWGGRRFGMQNLNYELDGLPGKGDIAVTLGKVRALDLKVSADALDLGSYVSNGTGVGALSPAGAWLLPSDEGFEKRLQLDFGKLTMNGVDAANVSINVNASASGFEIRRFDVGAVEGAELRGDGVVLTGPDGPSGEIKFVAGAERPQGLLRLLGMIGKGPQPQWAAGLGKTDLHADVSISPGKDEPQVNFSLTGTSGPYKVIGTGLAQGLAAPQGLRFGYSGSINSSDARDIVRLAGIAPQGGPAGDAQLSVTADATDTKATKLAMDFEGLGGTGGFSGTYQPRANSLALTGAVKIDADGIARLAAVLGVPIALPSGPFSLSGEVQPTGDLLSLNKLTMKLGPHALNGGGSLTPSGQLHLDLVGGKYGFGDLAALAFAPWNGVGSFPNGSFASGWPMGLTGDITAKPELLTDPLGQDFSSAVLRVAADGKTRSFKFSGTGDGGSVASFDGTLVADGAAQNLTAQGSYPLMLEQLMVKDAKPLMRGAAMITGRFSATGRSPRALLSGLSGSGVMNAGPAKITGLAPDPFFAVATAAKSNDEIQHAFAALNAGDGIDVPQAAVKFIAKDGALSFETSEFETQATKVSLTPSADLANVIVGIDVELVSKAQTDLPPVKVIYQGAPGSVQVRADGAALSSKLGTALINKDMQALAKLQEEQKKAEAEAQAQTAADQAKFDAFQEQRAELRLMQREQVVYAKQRALDATRAKAALEAAVSYGLSIVKEEKRRFLQRLGR